MPPHTSTFLTYTVLPATFSHSYILGQVHFEHTPQFSLFGSLCHWVLPRAIPLGFPSLPAGHMDIHTTHGLIMLFCNLPHTPTPLHSFCTHTHLGPHILPFTLCCIPSFPTVSHTHSVHTPQFAPFLKFILPHTSSLLLATLQGQGPNNFLQAHIFSAFLDLYLQGSPVVSSSSKDRPGTVSNGTGLLRAFQRCAATQPGWHLFTRTHARTGLSRCRRGRDLLRPLDAGLAGLIHHFGARDSGLQA